jgi:hypothetical protein
LNLGGVDQETGTHEDPQMNELTDAFSGPFQLHGYKCFFWIKLVLIGLYATGCTALAQNQSSPAFTRQEIARFSAQAEYALRSSPDQQKTIFGILYLNERLGENYDGLFRSFKDMPRNYAKLQHDYTAFENSYDTLSGQAPYKVPTSTEQGANLFFDLLIATGHPGAVGFGNAGKQAVGPAFRLYEAYQELPGVAYSRSTEFKERYREADNNLAALLANLVKRSENDPDLKNILENKIYSRIGFSPTSPEEKRKATIPSFYELEMLQENQIALNDLKKKSEATYAVLKQIDASSKKIESATSEKGQDQANQNLTIDDELKTLQEKLPQIIERQSELDSEAKWIETGHLMVSNIAAMLKLAGFEDKSGILKSVLAMSAASAQMAKLTSQYLTESLQSYANQKTLSTVDQIHFSVDVLSVFMSFAQAMTPGASPEAQMLQAMKAMLEQMQSYLNQQFLLIDQRFDAITGILTDQFKQQKLLIQQSRDQILSLQNKLDGLNTSMNQQTNLVLNAIEAGFDQLSRQEFRDAEAGRIPWTTCRDHVIDHALSDSHSDLHMFHLDFREMNSQAISEQTAKNLYKNISFLEHLGRSRFDRHSTERPDAQILNPQIWAVYVNQYLELIENANGSELSAELPNINALLAAYDRFQNPMRTLFSKDSLLFRDLFQKYESLYTKYLALVAAQAQVILRAQGLDFADIEKALTKISTAEEASGTLLRSNLISTDFVAGTQLKCIPGAGWGVENQVALLPEKLASRLDPRWLVAQRLGLVRVIPYLIPVLTSDGGNPLEGMYFGVAFYVSSTKLTASGEPEFHGIVKFIGKKYAFVEPVQPFNRAYNHGSALLQWPKVASDFVKNAEENNFYDARFDYQWGLSHGGWQLEAHHLRWLWDVWTLTSAPAAGSEADRINGESRQMIKDIPPETKRRVSNAFNSHRLFGEATRWEAENYLNGNIESQFKDYFQAAFILLNKELLKLADSGALEDQTRNELVATSSLIKSFLLLGYPKSFGGESSPMGLDLFSSEELLVHPPACNEKQCPNYVAMLFFQHRAALAKSQAFIVDQFVPQDGEWEEPVVFSELRRRLIAIRELINRSAP